MKRILKCSAIIGILTLLSIEASAQPQQCKIKRLTINKEKIATHQWAVVNRALTLDDATQAKFELVYKKYQAEKMALLPDTPNIKSLPREQYQPMTDTEADLIIKERLNKASKLADINKKYYTEFRKTLSPKQILKVFETEKQIYKHSYKATRKGDNTHKQKSHACNSQERSKQPSTQTP